MIELTTSLLMLASAFTSTGGQGTTTQAISSDQPLQTNTTISTEAYVRDYFKDTPILAEIARCESTFRQFDSNGNVIRGKVNRGDIGVMQINKYYHEDDATKLGLDIYTIDGNLAYARHLYEKYGDDPWSSSSKCWKQSSKAGKDIARN